MLHVYCWVSGGLLSLWSLRVVCQWKSPLGTLPLAGPLPTHGPELVTWLHQWQGRQSMQSDLVPRREEPKFLCVTPYFCSSHFLDGSPCPGGSNLFININTKLHSLCSVALWSWPMLGLHNLSPNCCSHLQLWRFASVAPYNPSLASQSVNALKSQSTQVSPFQIHSSGPVAPCFLQPSLDLQRGRYRIFCF